MSDRFIRVRAAALHLMVLCWVRLSGRPVFKAALTADLDQPFKSLAERQMVELLQASYIEMKGRVRETLCALARTDLSRDTPHDMPFTVGGELCEARRKINEAIALSERIELLTYLLNSTAGQTRWKARYRRRRARALRLVKGHVARALPLTWASGGLPVEEKGA